MQQLLQDLEAKELTRGVPTGGAVRCIEALLQAYPEAFSKADAEEAMFMATITAVHNGSVEPSPAAAAAGALAGPGRFGHA